MTPRLRLIALAALSAPLVSSLATAAVLHVPADHATIQAAIDAAQDGDTVSVARGVYVEALVIAGKSVTLVSPYAESGDPADRRHTVIDGGVYGQADLVRQDAAITVAADAGAKTRIEGFTIRNGDDGVKCHTRIAIVGNRFINNVDGIDYENGGGLCQGNLFVAHQDDAVDVDESSSVEILDNVIRDCADDGVEIRLHEYRGPVLAVVLRNNVICGSGENGIQIIDYPEPSDRHLSIERNLIVQSVKAGIGVMSDGVTLEDYRSTHLPEPLDVVNNTLVGNPCGISGGGNAVIMNNLIVGSNIAGLKDVGSKAVVLNNVCWQNAADVTGEITDGVPQVADPKFDSRYRTAAGGACVDSGRPRQKGPDGRSVVADAALVRGAAPDVGRDEN